MDIRRLVGPPLRELVVRPASGPPAPPSRREVSLFRPPEITSVDYPNVCAVTGLFNAARFVWKDGLYRYAQTIKVTTDIFRNLYDGKPWVQCEITEQELELQSCPRCGAQGTPVHCGKCGRWVCRGLTTWKHFRCICGGSGTISGEMDPRGMPR